ncbi:sensor histidine kinase [Dyadobacter sp. CY356]|uniref:sensor histidine kinase n=1 Tax=Dyadobacter sp. CY356 TaxID=2906442 RepID=UPI001F17AACC|nr:sensor histidine kinase [Dyadobacter sp. CY356]MCF0056195.1 ATP-binding protein [Dyadobacter sp. CY356]
MKVTKLVLLIVILCRVSFFSLSVKAQSSFSRESEMGHPLSKVYVPADYNAHGQNFSITQDKSGIIYLANFAGVLEYDGVNWKTILTENISRVSSLLTDKTGRVLVGANGEFGYLGYDSLGVHKFISLSRHMKQKIGPVTQILEMPDGIYFISSDAWFIWDGKKVRIQKNSFQTSTAFGLNGRILVYSRNNGLLSVRGKSVTTVEKSPDVPVLLDVVSLVPLNNDAALVVTTNQGIFKLVNNRLYVLSGDANEQLIANKATYAIRLVDNSIVVSMLTGGLLVISEQGNLLYPLLPGGGIQDSQVSFLFNDRDGYLWLALNDGIGKMNIPSPISRFDSSNGLKGEVTSICRFDGKLYVGTLYGLYYIDNNYVKKIDSFQGSVLAFEKFGNALMIATNRGVVLWQPGSGIQNLTNEFALSVAISKTYPNKAFVGLQNGLEELTRSASGWTVTKVKGVDEQIVGIRENANQVWLETLSNGLMKWDRQTGQVKRYTEREGLKSPLYNKVSGYNGKIIVSNKDGIFVYKPEKDQFGPFNILNDKQDVANSWYDQLIEDDNQNIWATRGDKREIAFFKKKAGVNLSFTKIQQPFKPVSGISFQVMYPDKDQVVWAGGDQGLYRMDMKVTRNYFHKYPTLIRELSSTNGKLISGGLVFSDSSKGGKRTEVLVNFAQNNIAIEYALPSYNVNQEIEYQFYLENFDKNWSDWSSLTHKEYSGLQPGKYNFRVRGRDIYGNISQEAVVPITVSTPWFMTWWMIAIYAGVFSLLIYYTVRWRLQAVIREKRGLETLIRERTEEVVNQKEELEKQSEELSSTNDQLERIDDFVKSINGEVNTGKLFQLVLERLCLFQNVDSASALVHSKSSDSYQFIAMAGTVDLDSVSDVKLSYAQAAQRYIDNGKEVFEDIFLKNNFTYENLNSSIDDIYAPKSLITILIRVEGAVKSFITLENMDHENAFGDRDFHMVKNLKEHLIGAYIKTSILENLENTLTNLKSTQQELIRQEKLASVGQLTKGIVDRILNPLNYINNFSQSSKSLLQEIEEVTEKYQDGFTEDDQDDLGSGVVMLKKNLEKIYEHGASTTRIVKDMQKLLKGKSTEFLITELNPFLETKAKTALAEVLADYKGCELHIDFDLYKMQVKVSLLPYEFTEVLQNLISNACYAVIEKSKTVKDYVPQVSIKTNKTREGICIQFRDNGKGIPQKEIEQIFSPFFTTKPTSKGTGLGLYMSKDIVQYHKGEMSINSEVGEFTIVEILLPVII